jgi:hypothetical protein
MASSGKKKTTMAKLMRESKLREKRLDKQARKDARKLAAANGSSDWLAEAPNPMGEDADRSDAEQPDAQPDLEAVARAQSGA